MSTRPTGLVCLNCGAQTDGVVLCGRCVTTTDRALTNIEGYVRDLLDLPSGTFGLRRAKRVADPTGECAASASSADPIEQAADDTKELLEEWVTRLIRARPQLRYPAEEGVDDLIKLLRQQMRSIIILDWAGDFMRAMTRAEGQLRRLLAARKGRRYAGVCGHVLDEENGDFCTQVLYAVLDSDKVWCPACNTTWPLAERRQILLDAARDQETNVATIARALVALLDDQPSQSRLERRIQNWIDRGKLERRGHVDVDGKVRRTYRLGDVLDLLLDDRATRPKVLD